MSRPTFATINLSALKHNLARVRELAPNARVLAMVKANAYGHGIVRTAKALASADALGVASIDEGVSLREAGVTTPIVLMEGLFHPDELALAAKHQFQLVVHHEPHIQMLLEAHSQHAFSVWLKINTGMNRLGFKPEAALEHYNRLNAAPAVTDITLMTHFAEADDPQSTATQQQVDSFTRCTAALPNPKSLANSAAILAWQETHADWVRPGLMLYGASPLAGQTGAEFDLKPVMTLHSEVIALADVAKGERIGYGGTFIADRDMRVAVVGVGYGDGYPQFASSGTPVLINNQKAPLVGRVSMDMITVDATQLTDVQVGDKVVLWGDELPVETVAKFAQTTAYEVLTRTTMRPRVTEKG